MQMPSFHSNQMAGIPTTTSQTPRLRSNPPSPNTQPMRYTGRSNPQQIINSTNPGFRRSSAPDDPALVQPGSNRLGQVIQNSPNPSTNHQRGTNQTNSSISSSQSHTSNPSNQQQQSQSQHERRDSTVVDLTTDLDSQIDPNHPSSYSHPAQHGALPLRPGSRASLRGSMNRTHSGNGNGWRISDESNSIGPLSDGSGGVGMGLNRPYSPDAGYGSSSTSASGGGNNHNNGGMSLGMAMDTNGGGGGGSSSSRAPSNSSTSISASGSNPQLLNQQHLSSSNQIHPSMLNNNGYASSFDGDFVSAPPSRLISRSNTPSFTRNDGSLTFSGLQNISLREVGDEEIRQDGNTKRRRRRGDKNNHNGEIVESDYSDARERRRRSRKRSTNVDQNNNSGGLLGGLSSLLGFGAVSNQDSSSRSRHQSKSKSRNHNSKSSKAKGLSSAFDSNNIDDGSLMIDRKRSSKPKWDKGRDGMRSESESGSGSESRSSSSYEGTSDSFSQSEDYSGSTSSSSISRSKSNRYYNKSKSDGGGGGIRLTSSSKSRRSSRYSSSRKSRVSSSTSLYNYLSKSLHPLNPFRIFLPLLRLISFLSSIPTISLLILLVLITTFVTSITFLIMYILNPDKEAVPWRSYCSSQPNFPHSYADSLKPIDIFVGVFSTDSQAASERRHLIRNTYAAHTLPLNPDGSPRSNINLKFILGKPRKGNARRIALEKEVWNDLVVLDIDENMNRGKTFEFFKWANENATVPIGLPRSYAKGLENHLHGLPGEKELKGEIPELAVGWKKVDFVVKADDDAFLVLDELERHLRIAPKNLTYWGCEYPKFQFEVKSQRRFSLTFLFSQIICAVLDLIRNWFMGGECYALSSDLVSYVANSPIVSQYTTGKEDKKVAQWINLHPSRSSINFVSEQCWIYDGPKSNTAYSHGYLFPDEVERIKMEEKVGLPEKEIEERGGEHKRLSYSTVSKWKVGYKPPREGMTMEEEVEALIEGGGRWRNNDWYRGNSTMDDHYDELWLEKDKVLFESKDERFDKFKSLQKRKGLNKRDEESENSREEVRDQESSSPRLESRDQSHRSGWFGVGIGGDRIADRTRPNGGGILPNLNLLQTIKSLTGNYHISLPSSNQNKPEARSNSLHQSPSDNSIPIPVSKEGFPSDGPSSLESLRARRYLYRPHGGTVVVHFLKKNEWFMETSVALLGNGKTWIDGAGGVASEWRMWGSPVVRNDGYVSEGRPRSHHHQDLQKRIHQEIQVESDQEDRGGVQQVGNEMLGRDVESTKNEEGLRKRRPFGTPWSG